jgi:hypothetical protein
MGVNHRTKDARADAAANKAGSAEWNADHLAPPFLVFSMQLGANAAITWGTPPPTESPFGAGGGGDAQAYTIFLAQNVTQVRFQAHVTAASTSATMKLYPLVNYYRTDLPSFVTEPAFNVAAAGQLAVNTTGYKDTGWQPMNANLIAAANAYLNDQGGIDNRPYGPVWGIFGINGNNSPLSIAQIHIHCK